MPPIPSKPLEELGGVEYIGIDPGASGGLASILVVPGKLTSRIVVEAVAMPATEKDLWLWVAQDNGTNVYAVLEQNTGYVGDRGNPGSAMFKFGKSHGLCEMALAAAAVPYEKITPATWQKGLGISRRDKKETKTQFKNRLKARAQQLYPSVNVTLSVSDALLIAHYCRLLHEGKL